VVCNDSLNKYSFVIDISSFIAPNTRLASYDSSFLKRLPTISFVVKIPPIGYAPYKLDWPHKKYVWYILSKSPYVIVKGSSINEAISTDWPLPFLLTQDLEILSSSRRRRIRRRRRRRGFLLINRSIGIYA